MQDTTVCQRDRWQTGLSDLWSQLKATFLVPLDQCLLLCAMTDNMDNRGSEQQYSPIYRSLVDTLRGKCLDPRREEHLQREVGVTSGCREPGVSDTFFLSRVLNLII